MEEQEIRNETTKPENEQKAESKLKKTRGESKKGRFNCLLEELLESERKPILKLVFPDKYRTHQYRDKQKNTLKELSKELLELGLDIQIKKTASKELQRLIKDKDKGKDQIKHNIEGYGHKKESNFTSWVESKIKGKGPHIYLWKKGNKFLYVGRGGDKRRVSSYKKSKYLIIKGTTIKVWFIKNPSEVPAAECLAWHLYKPLDNKNKPSRSSKKRDKKCPICELKKELKKQIDKLL